MRKILPVLSLFLLISLLWGSDAANARVYIDVTKPFSRKLPLALPDYQPMQDSAPSEAGPQGTRLLKGNLNFTGIFDILDPRGYLGAPDVANPNYKRWTRIGAELLITGSYRQVGQELSVEMRLFDAAEGRLLVGRRYDGIPADLPRMMNRFADEVMLAITGERSVFSSQIAFVSARQGKSGVTKEIHTMNFDGSRVRQFTDRQDICLYPSWSSDGSLITYSSYVKRRPAIFVHALAGGQGKLVLNKPGVNITPRFLPGSSNLAVAMSHTGKTNIFLVDMAGSVLRKLTDGWGIEVAPTFSPDGRQMAYVSDSGGPPQIYVLDMGTGETRRISYGFKYCSSPDWSPRGDRIAFQAMIDGVFQVCTVTPDGKDVQVLTSGFGGAEDPCWSPDGRLIAYAGRQTGRYQIYVMTANGQPIRRLTNLPGENTDPAWSPRGVVGR